MNYCSNITYTFGTQEVAYTLHAYDIELYTLQNFYRDLKGLLLAPTTQEQTSHWPVILQGLLCQAGKETTNQPKIRH